MKTSVKIYQWNCRGIYDPRLYNTSRRTLNATPHDVQSVWILMTEGNGNWKQRIVAQKVYLLTASSHFIMKEVNCS